MKFGIVVFPGSNCDYDCQHVLSVVLGQETEMLWHESHDLKECDCIVLPGGFSYGDYLRTGAIARFSPVMESIRNFIEAGGVVVGICNGFQILVESQLLPGALLPNQKGHFICRHVHLRVENTDTPFTRLFYPGEVISIPIAHHQGNYFIPHSSLSNLQKNRQIIFRYCDMNGQINHGTNPNGSIDSIAGIISSSQNVLGMMPHPERSSEAVLGSHDGKRIFLSIIQWWEENHHARQ